MEEKVIEIFEDNIEKYIPLFEKDYSLILREKEKGKTFILYFLDNQYISMKISFALFNHEIEINILFNDHSFCFQDLYSYIEPQNKISMVVFNHDEICKVTETTMAFLLNIGGKLFFGDREFFINLFSYLSSKKIPLALEDELRNVRKKLDIAWGNKDYILVEKLLYPHLEYLSTSEIMKYRYAKNRVP